MMTEQSFLGVEPTPRLPFGRFFGRVVGERSFAGFRLAQFVPTLPKREVRRHCHDEAHFVFVLRGEYETQARPVRSPGSPLLIYSPPGTTHRDCFVDEDLSVAAFVTLSVSPALLAEVDTEAELPEEEICLAESAVALVRQILREARGPNGAGAADDLTGLVTEGLCLELLQRTGVARDPAVSSAPGWLRRARELLRDTGPDASPPSVGEIAAELGVHPVHLARRFRRHFGQTPGEYLRRCRLDRARRLLRKSSAGLAEIATAGGFSDQSHFTNAFRRGFGISPGAFRRSR